MVRKVKYDAVSDIENMDKIQDSGFPEKSLSKVVAKLEENKINYIIIDRNENYREVEKEDFKDKNKYQQTFIKSIQLYNKKYLFEKEIVEVIQNNLKNEKTDKVLKHISEYLKKEFGGR